MRRILLLALLPFFAAPVMGSGISTNGGDPTMDQANVWFLGDEPVEYCVEASEFMDRDAMRALVRESIDDWRAFFRKYGLDQLKFTGLAGSRNLGLALRWREVPRCTQPLKQVRFLFGVKTPEIERALALQSNAFGLSYREEYDNATFRTGGQVFLRDLPYDDINKLKHVLLHELGHVFGMEHDSVYVMDANVADVVRGVVPAASGFGKIEAETWPYRLEDGQTIEFSANGRWQGKYEPNFVIVFLRDLFGFARDGYHSAVLHLAYLPGANNAWHATFDFTDYATGVTKTLDGTLFVPESKSDFKGLRGPSLYTNWACAACEDGAMMYLKHLDGRPSGMDATGTFRFGDTEMPAVMEQKKGFYVRAFVPSARMWWSTENYISSYFTH